MKYLSFKKDTYHCRVLWFLLLETSLLSDMQSQVLVVNSSEELVLIHSLYNAEDVLRNAAGEKKKKNWKNQTNQNQKPRLNALRSSYAYTQHFLIHFELQKKSTVFKIRQLRTSLTFSSNTCAGRVCTDNKYQIKQE